MSARLRDGSLQLCFVAAALLFLAMLFAGISRPLHWFDEADTAMFAVRVLEHGYPKVHGERNVVYGTEAPIELGAKAPSDAYIGGLWGQYYFAVPGVWWARAVDDLYARTARVRLPFAIAGATGLALLFLAVRPAFGSVNPAQLAAGTLYAARAATSVSLILHLREARYYALVVLLMSGSLWLHLRVRESGRAGPLGYAVAQSVCLVLLFNTFFPAALAVGVWLLLRAARQACIDGGDRRTGVRRALVAAAPVVAAAVCVVPVAVFFEMPAIAEHVAGRGAASGGGYAARLAAIFAHLLRYEMLGPVLAAEAGLGLARRWRPDAASEPAVRTRLCAARALSSLCVLYVAIVAAIPFFFERYFVVLSPLLSLVFLLDAFALVEWIGCGAAAPNRRRASLFAATALVLCAAAAVGIQLPEIRGRIHEIRVPYRGPLDFAIPYLRERYPDTRNLRIATNYEAAVYMYYLESRVSVGYYGVNLDRDREVQPDVIIPRPWASQRDVLDALARRGNYTVRAFPVENLVANNVPGLSRSSPGGIVHRFRTPIARASGGRFRILEGRSTPGDER